MTVGRALGANSQDGIPAPALCAVHMGKLVILYEPVSCMQNGINCRVTSQDHCGGTERQLENASAWAWLRKEVRMKLA